MSWLSDLGSSIANAFSSVCETVGKIGTAVSNFAHAAKPVLGPILQTIEKYVPHPAVKAVASFANTLLQALSIFRPDETVQDMGDRALQASEKGITQDKFENFDEYMGALRDFDVNPEASAKFSLIDKFIAGLGVATSGIEDKFKVEPGSLNDMWILPLTNPGYFSPDRIKSMLENGKEIGDVSAYLGERMDGVEAKDFRKNYEFTPDGKPMNDTELGKLYEALDSARGEWASLEKQIKDSN